MLWVVSWHYWYRDEPAEHPDVTPEELAFIRQDEVAGLSTGRTRESNIPWRRIATNRNLYTICLMYFCFGYGLYFYFTWLPTYLIRVLGFSNMAGGIWAGMPFVLAGGADVAGGWLTDHLSKAFGLKIGRSWLGFVAFSGSAALLYESTRMADRTGKAMLIVLALACADLALSACWAVCLDVGKNFAGIVTGCMNTFGNLGGVVGPIVVGYAIQWWNSWSIPFYITSVIYFIGALSWLAIDPRERIVPPREATS
jgi:nitrate/nitrite transporter NarK